MNILKNSNNYNVVVIGTGLAGIKAAVTAAKSGSSVMLCTKSVLCSGSSFYSLMDSLHCQSVIDDEDKSVFLQDIKDCSYKMNNATMNEYYVNNIKQRIEEFEEIGVMCEKVPEPKLACFATHPHSLYSWSNWAQIRTRLHNILLKMPNITLREGVTVTNILTHNQNENQITPCVNGIVLYDKKAKQYEEIACQSVVLATGGFGGLYEHNLNSPDVCGDGHALAINAGAQLINLEFNQFIPGFINPVYKVVFREGTLDYGKALLNKKGEDVLRKLIPNDEEYYDCLKMRAYHGPFTSVDNSKLFDIAIMKTCISEEHENGVEIVYDEKMYSDERSYVKGYLDWLKDVHNVNLCETKVTIAPFFHAANGGIYVNENCETKVKGLFACGEAAGGIHGADRLGGNATGSCLVFGHLAGKNAAEYSKCCKPMQQDSKINAENELENAYNSKVKSQIEPDEAISQIKKLMWRYAGVLRCESELNLLANKLNQIKNSYNAYEYLSAPATAAKAIQAQNAIVLASALVCAMQNRKESRGSHYREDYPQQSNEYNKRICIFKSNGDIDFAFENCKD